MAAPECAIYLAGEESTAAAPPVTSSTPLIKLDMGCLVPPGPATACRGSLCGFDTKVLRPALKNRRTAVDLRHVLQQPRDRQKLTAVHLPRTPAGKVSSRD